ncbi:cytochrome C oxidase assembly protein [Cohnella kolymensis]|uniref:Cytochrome C oxidase assembly protein n=1 Tax=Cohnella kolymensis TaxID=1590652 RepID=A0ABR5A8X9_9BACL|nr:cytochrome c oxidase assembly factor CtaG [Cohnella kolymensis]KIL37511.1 cytochrome C oxidase assembly protein [Cohnella kolymensis]
MWGLEYFSFRDLWSPLFMVFMMAVIVLYTFVVGPWRDRFAGGKPVSFTRQASFIAAAVLLYFTQGGPLSLLGHLMFTFHMTNMAISYILVPPMLIYGIPDWLWRAMFKPKFWRMFRILLNPIISLGLFIFMFSFYHMPDNHDYIMTNFTVHTVYYIALLISAMLMWWQICCPVPEWNRISALMKLGYIFLSGLLLTPACVMIIFASSPLFAVYSDPDVWVKAMGYCVSGDSKAMLSTFDGPGFFNLMTPLEDQQLGGIVMKLLQEFVNAAALYAVFMQWYRSERSREDEPVADAPAGSRLNNV